jgi:glycosyltransferase involved in cell wall biosynthesis
MVTGQGQATIGFYSNTAVLGGSEVYLKILLEHIHPDLYTVRFFCPSYHPLAAWARQQPRVTVTPIDHLIKTRRPQPRGEGEDQTNPVRMGKKEGKNFLRELIPPQGKLLMGTVKDIWRLKSLFQRHPVDLLHFNDTGCEPPVIAARLAGVKRIVGTFHVLPSYDPEKTDMVRRVIENVSNRGLHRAIAVSQATRQAWMERTGIDGNKIDIIYNGINLSQFPRSVDIQQMKRNLGIAEKDKVIGVPARLHPMKGHRYLIDAVPQIKRHIPHLKVLLMGEGPLREELTAQIKAAGLTDTCLLLGHREDIRELLCLLDVGILPSVSLETFGLALVEMMACRKAVVASRFSGIPEVVLDGETGLLVPPGNPPALAEAVIALLNDPQRCRRMGEKGRERAEQYFTQEQMLKKTFAFYEGMLNGLAKSSL